MDNITYGRSGEAWQDFEELLKQFIQTHEFKNILDIGGGANPILSPDYVERMGLSYSILDISEAELKKASATYHKIVKDITANDLKISDKFDMVFTKMLAEHIRDGERLHKNIHVLLKENGIAIHFFPTLYALPFLINKLIPEKINKCLLARIAPRDNYQHAKFPAYYNWCTGPTPASLKRFERLGYEVLEYKGLYGHAGYYRRVPPINMLHLYLVEFLLKHPNPYLTSYAYIILRKPLGSCQV